jgi:hypothetical protein
MLGSLGVDYAKLFSTALDVTAAKQKAAAEAKVLAAQTKLQNAANRAGATGAPMISQSTKIGLMIGIPAVLLLGAALFMRSRQGGRRRR